MAKTDTNNADWPATDSGPRTAAGYVDAADVPAPTPPRRLSQFAVDLATAIRRTSEAARDAQLAVVADEAKGVSQHIQEQLVGGAATLRMRSEDDIADIREWAKAETARIKVEADARTAARKHLLEEQLAAHAAVASERSAQMEAAVNTYRATMDEFFRHFLAEEDPARLATIAETMPEPPSLEPFLNPDPTWPSLASAPVHTLSASDADAAEAEAEPAWSADEAEAEAEAALLTESLVVEPPAARAAAPEPLKAAQPAAVHDPSLGEAAPTKAVSAAPAGVAHSAVDAGAEVRSTQIIVTGLVSVASVASFRRALGRLPGVSAVTVTSGPYGEFLFHTSHRWDVDFDTVIPSLAGFAAEITGKADGAISVTTPDPEIEH